MASSICVGRLNKEYKDILKDPIESIKAAPKKGNILEWHYVLEGCKTSPYNGGHYHGVLTFPQEYPLKPPSIKMLTPNGRFQPNTKLCLSMSDFHPESWTPNWGVRTILLGLYSFMSDTSPTVGSVNTTYEYKREQALLSLEYNCRNEDFADLFPSFVELQQQRKKAALEASLALCAAAANNTNVDNSGDNNSSSNNKSDNINNINNDSHNSDNVILKDNKKGNSGTGGGFSHLALVAVLGAIVASLYVIFNSVS